VLQVEQGVYQFTVVHSTSQKISSKTKMSNETTCHHNINKIGIVLEIVTDIVIELEV